MTRLHAPLSLDLDNKWSYLMTHGDRTWESYPSYLETAVPRILDFLDDRDLKITFFVVGRDAAMPQHRDVLREIAVRGHEIANHSFDHQPWLHLYSAAELAADFDKSDSAIESSTGVRPIGFRGPGFSISGRVLTELTARGYRYDASVFPNILNPASRAYYFWKSDLSKEERKKRRALFGTLRSAFQPNTPFQWEVDGARMIEVPVSTMPLFRTPIHLSYLTFLAGKLPVVASTYFRLALLSFRVSGNLPSMLLHPLDFLGCDDDEDLGFFPGMNMRSERKLEFASHFLDMLGKQYDLVPMETYIGDLDPRRLLDSELAAQSA